MFTSKLLSGLKLGDHVETGPLFKGLSKESVVWALEVIDGETYHFTVTWFGVLLGRYIVTIEEGETVRITPIKGGDHANVA